MPNNEYITNLQLELYSTFMISNEVFIATYRYTNNNHFIKGVWKNAEADPFMLSSLTEFFGIIIPDFVNEIILKTISLSYNTDNDDVEFEICSNYGDFGIESKTCKVVKNLQSKAIESRVTLGSEDTKSQRTCKLKLLFKNLSFKFSQLPVVGTLVQGGDYFRVDNFDFEYNPCNATSKTTFNLNFALIIDDKQVYPEDKPEKYLRESKDKELITVKWIDVNKSFKVLHFDKIGIAFDGNYIIVYLNAGFSIMSLQLDFYGLYLSIPLAPEKEFDYGLNGLAVTFNRDPIAISGGLYHIIDDKYKDLYNGELMVKFSKYSFTALGSYCENDNKPSFFMYLMLGIPLGGPPCFFVNGLALGMGVNRGVRLPDIKSVDKFPFVAAAMGNSKSNLKPESKISDVLTELSQWIYPSNDEFFITAGIKFNSFGILNSFALLTVEFGKKLRFSLLGLSEASIPPNLESKKQNPIAYAKLALKVTFDPGEGIIEVLAALSDESYILDKNCKLTGGFALCAWLQGQRKGDFFVSLGGCHNPNFVNRDAHGNVLYPELDKVGVNWRINNNLKLVADGYFAITPACMMAGASLSLTYEAGNLKAWLNAVADFFIKWKPFFYEAYVSICVGASYTIKIFGIRKTFSVELGASLNLWGPEFSGKIRIKWFIISFTISFGDAPRTADPIDWNDFSKSFLPENKETKFMAENSSTKTSVNNINISEGLLKIEGNKGSEIYRVSGDGLKIVTNSVMPCTKILIKGKDTRTVAEYDGKLGVVPMGKVEYTSTITITLTNEGQPVDLDQFTYTKQNGNFPPALWKSGEPGINEGTPIEAIAGIEVSTKQPNIAQILPQIGFYEMKELLNNEPIYKYFSWINEELPKNEDYSEYKGDGIIKKLSETIKENKVRTNIVNLLSNKFGLESSINIKDIGNAPKNYLMDYPLLKTTGGSMTQP